MYGHDWRSCLRKSNEVSNSFSVSSSDISDSLGNMSAVMSQTGASFEQSLGMLTAITEVTRSANKASRGLVSIGSRLNQITDESSSIGKALKDIYTDLGITLFDSAGQIRSSYDIFYDLSQIWDTLDKNTQNLIASQQAGKMLLIQSRYAGTCLELYVPSYKGNFIVA